MAFIFLIMLFAAGVAVLGYFSLGTAQARGKISWGVDFSQSYAEYLGLDWRRTYLAMIDDLGAKNLKLHTQWNFVEGKISEYYFDDIDWQIKQAEEKNVKIIYVLGVKTGRWPECHMPEWSRYFPENLQKAKLLEYILKVVNRYKDSQAISYWQIENEPFLRFGKCPSWYYQDADLLKAEIDLVKSIDPSRKIIISDSGEKSMWFGAAKLGDIVGITMYRNSWNGFAQTFGVNPYAFLSPIFYLNKAQAVKRIFGKDVICVELQSEPWPSKPMLQASLEEQAKSMNPDMFKENIEFAKKTGLSQIFFWGAEWWLWMKEKQNLPEVWEEAKKVFSER